ncbi:MAG: glycosyltransferase family 4 protein [bacterium]|nr:glycosyltransferase family 4 protein [Candidatus Kapabacteria bacterium]
MKTRLCVIANDGVLNPATRLRIAQFVPAFEDAGYTVETFYVPYSDGVREWSMRELYTTLRASDVVFVQRALSWPLLRLLQLAGRPFVFDFDDALHYIRQRQYSAALAPTSMRDRAVVLYRTIVRGGRFYSSRKRMLDSAIRNAAAVVVVPTSVAVDEFPMRKHGNVVPVRIGWIGVPSNLFHLRLLESVFATLTARYGDRIRLVIVSNVGLDDLPIDTEFVQWSLETESDVTASFDIGIMPLQDDFFSRGKCSFKAIYCMGHGVPVVISPVGMNTELVENGVNGFLADGDDEWVDALARLIDDSGLRATMGAAARATIEERYSSNRIFALLRGLLAGITQKTAPIR